MKAKARIVVLALGGALVIIGIVRSFNTLDIHSTFAWSMIAVFGLFLTAWGTIEFLFADDTGPTSSRDASASSVAIDTNPSANSHAGKRQEHNK